MEKANGKLHEKPALKPKTKKVVDGISLVKPCLLCGHPYDTDEHQCLQLPCTHTFCSKCLAGLCHGRQKLKCPSCRSLHGVERIHKLKYSQKVISAQGKTGGEDSLCTKHMSQPRLFYCQTCKVAICMHCTVIDHDKTNGHAIVDINQAKSEHLSAIQACVDRINIQLEHSQALLDKLNIQSQCLEASKTMAEQRLEQTFRQLHEQLDKRQASLAQELQGLYGESKTSIRRNALEIKQVSQKLSEKKSDLEELKSSLDQDFRAARAPPTPDEDTSVYQLQVHDHSGCLNFNFKHNLEEYLLVQRDVGNVTGHMSLPSSVKMSIPAMNCGIPSKFSLAFLSASKKAVSGVVVAAKVSHLHSTAEPQVITGEYKPKTTSYTFDFHPVASGDYQVTPIFCDVPLLSCTETFTVTPNNPVQVIGLGQLKHPSSIAVSKAGYIYVADTGNKRIQVFEDDGTPSFVISLNGATTYDVCINRATEVLLYTRVTTHETGQTITHTVQMTDLNGEPLFHFTNGEMQRAMFLCINSKGQIVVSDSSQNCVYIYSKEGIPIKKFGSHGSKPGQFDFPTAVCIGAEDCIYVSDTRNDRVQMFDKGGQHKRTYGPNLAQDIHLQAPRGLAIDKHRVLIADSAGRIVVIDSRAKVLWTITSLDNKIPEPYNMTIAAHHVYVADFKNNCIKKFKIS